jgi:transposase InsO family protein
MRRGVLYLVAVMDWATRKVLAWRVSNTMDVEFCIEALEEALARFGRPEIFNTDQGSQGGFKWSSQHPATPRWRSLRWLLGDGARIVRDEARCGRLVGHRWRGVRIGGGSG